MASHLGAMVAMVRHRGPDGERTWTDGEVGLGHARLAVIDPSPEAAQPMSDAEGRVWVVHNGEIYNFMALREELAAAGHRFRTRSDTEVIVAGYEAWGEAVVERLRGMFAFALWDGHNRRLLLARDRLGQKPLYYRHDGGSVIFGSEIKAILAWPGVAREADLGAVHRYLSLGYVPGPGSAFRGIARLEPAQTMVVGPGGAVRRRRYWQAPAPEAARPQPRAALREGLLARLDEAVRLRLIADVPLGAFLSGGVDSASVVAAMAAAGPVASFTVGFAEAGFDERPYARAVAAHLGTRHHEEMVSPDALAVLPRLVWHFDQPFADSSAVATWYVAEMTRRHVTVALSGDGGDEAFLGYPRYAGCRLGRWLDRLPRPLRRALAARARASGLAASDRRGLRYLGRFLADADRAPAERYARWVSFFTEADQAALYGEALRPHLAAPGTASLTRWLEGGPVGEGRAAWADLHTYLPDDLLVKVDIAAMAHGLEVRAPFLDHELLVFALSIPGHQRMRIGETKALLKEVAARRLPKKAIYRRKQGFNVPIERWLRGPLGDLARDTLTGERARARGLFRPSVVRALIDDHLAGRRRNHDRIWALLMLELWFATWIDPPAPPTAPVAP